MPITGAHHKQPSLNKTTGPQRLGEAITREDIGNLMNVMDERVDRKLDELLKVMKEHFCPFRKDISQTRLRVTQFPQQCLRLP